MIDTIVFVPEVGMLYYGKVVRILNFGAFVELAPGRNHLLTNLQPNNTKGGGGPTVGEETSKGKDIENRGKSTINLTNH